MDWTESRRERSEERDGGDMLMRERMDGAYDELDESRTRDSSKHRSKDNEKSSQREEKDRRSKGHERAKVSDKDAKDLGKDRVSSRDRRKEDRDEHDKDRSRNKGRDKDYDREKHKEKEREHDRDNDRKDRVKEKDRDKDRDIEKDNDRGREKVKEKNRDRERESDRTKDKERGKHKDRDEKATEKDRDREKLKEKTRERERDDDHDKERSKERERENRRRHEDDHYKSKDGLKDDKLKLDHEDYSYRDGSKLGKNSNLDEDEQSEDGSLGVNTSTTELEERLLKMKEERLKKKSEGVSEVLAWVSKSRKIEEKKNAEKEKALQLSKMFEEQDNIVQGDNEDEEASRHPTHDLTGVKVLHGLDKVIEGGAVVLTLKDQNILADGDLNEEVDKLENVEIGEQNKRNEAYKAAKKKTGTYDDKFSGETAMEKKMLPQYDDPIADEGLTLGAGGRFTAEAEKKLEELRRRIQGVTTNNRVEDLSSTGKISSDYYTHDEMLKFKKPKKKKSMRKKDKLDLDTMEAEAVSAGLGVQDLGSRNNGKRQATKEEQEKAEAEMRNNAYQSALSKADEASKLLRYEQTLPRKLEEDESGFADDDMDLYKSLERARKLALKKPEKKQSSGPQAIALLASSNAVNKNEDQNLMAVESHENKVVFTEVEEFVWGLQIDEENHKPDSEDVFMDEDEVLQDSRKEKIDEAGGWTEVKDMDVDEHAGSEDKEEIVPDETIHEVPVGKGLSSALKLLKDRGTLKESIDWGGRNMDKKKSKLVGIADNDGPKEIHIERTDEFGRIMTPKEAFRMISHKFHGKGPGKMKQEKRMRQYQEELKLKQMKNSDTPSLSVERMREAQARMKTPYLVLSGQVKPGQTSDPRSGFATVENDLLGGLTPMLGRNKVDHFLGIKRKPEPSNLGMPKKPK